MTVTTTYGFLQTSGGLVGTLDGEGDIIQMPNGGAAYAATDGLTTGGFAGQAAFSGLTGVDPSLALLTDGNIVVATESGGAIAYRIISQTGSTVVATTNIGDAASTNPDVAALTGGGFVLVNQNSFGTTDNDIDVRIYDNNGVVTQSFVVDSSNADDRDAQVAALSNGNFVVAWTRTIGIETEIWFAIYNPSGGVVLAPQLHDSVGTINRAVSICATSSGFAMVYEDNGWVGGSDVEITLSRRDATGILIGSTNISSNTTADEGPQVTRLSNGMLAVSHGSNVNADTDVVVTLVDPLGGAVLFSQVVAGGSNQGQDLTSNAIAAFGQAGLQVLSTNTSGALHEDTLQITRNSVSNAADDTINGDDAIDSMFGNGGADNLFGHGGNDFLSGGAGTDILDGGSGADVMNGGLNDDTYFVDSTADQAIELIGEGVDTVFSTAAYTLGENVENLTFTGSANITGIGNGGANVLTGNSGHNTLNGGEGADTMAGGLGDDIYVVDNVSDAVTELAGQGLDQIQASVNVGLVNAQSIETVILLGSADLSASGNLGDNSLIGNLGNNQLSGAGGDDILTGNAGNDILNGGVGADIMAGGLGDDTYYVDSVGDQVIESVGVVGVDHVFSAVNFSLVGGGVENLTLILGATNGVGNNLDNVIIGNGGNNSLTGGDGADTLDGGGGSDQLTGGAGADTMAGGLGDDSYYVDNVGDVVIELADQGFDTLYTSADFSIAATGIENLTMSGAGDIDAEGNGLDNTLLGNSGNNILAGGGGSDILNGGIGADTMIGGEGDDLFHIDNAGDVVIEEGDQGYDGVVSFVSVSLAGQSLEYAYLDGDLHADLTGNELDNELYGNQGDNILTGGLGADYMEGGVGDDIYYLDNAGDIVVEYDGDGEDKIYSSVNIFLIDSYVEHAELLGDFSLNLSGNFVDNILTGNNGDNTFVGYGGSDTFFGGGGVDTIDYSQAAEGIVVDLAAGTAAFDGDGGSDVFTSIENLIGSMNSDILTGAAGDNVLTGGAGDDILTGGAGDDILRGGVGIDQLNGGSNTDLATYSAAAAGVVVSLTLGTASNDGDGGTDTLSGIENLRGSAFGDELTGSGAVNVLLGGAGGDTLNGMNGDDTLIGGVGVDVLNGGGGIDTVDYGDAAGAVNAQLNANKATNDGDGGTDTFSGIENLNGSAFNDTLIGDGNFNVLIGGLGSDTLLGLGGADVLWGGTGALNALQGGLGDDLYVLEAADTVTEFGGEGTDTVDARINTYVLAANVENLLFGGAGNFNGTGNALGNVITGGGGADNLRGRGGIDVLNGGLGIDTVDYTLAAAGVTARLDLQKATNDGDGATDTFTGIENLTGSNFNDTLIGDGNANLLQGGIGSDLLLGGGGADILMGGSGGVNNQLQGGMGDDLYILDAFDTCVEAVGEGIDTVEARVGAYTLGANVENLLYTGPGKFVGNGNTMDNILTGAGLDDIFRGKGGNDTIHGGLGKDEVQLRGVAAEYTVTVEGNGYRVLDLILGRDGSTFVDSVEVLRFVNNTTMTLSYPPASKAIGAEVSPLLEDDAFVLPAVVDDQPLVLPGVDAAKLVDDEPLVLPGAEEAAPLFANLEAHLPFVGDWMIALDTDGHLAGPPSYREGGWF